MNATILQTQSALILMLLFLGIYLHRKRKAHITIMTSAVIWDIILILQIELGRGAIAKATSSLIDVSNKIMLNIHVSIAMATVILYFVQMYLGRRGIKKKNANSLKRHRVVGYITVTMRVLTFITSFFIK